MKKTLSIYLLVSQVFFVACATESKIGAKPRTTDSVLQCIIPKVEQKLKKQFVKAKINFPPKEMALLAFKKEKVMEMWAKDDFSEWTYIRNYPIVAASGSSGPKLKEGDKQVPEGVYQLEYLNPNSEYHLSLKVGYPNVFDKIMAQKEGRSNLGGDIFIHGSNGSTGCLAMGNPNVESIYVAVAKTGIENVKVIIAPNDIRKDPIALCEQSLCISWIQKLYDQIKSELVGFDLKRKRAKS